MMTTDSDDIESMLAVVVEVVLLICGDNDDDGCEDGDGIQRRCWQ